MAYVMVSSETTKQADDLRKMMIQAAFDLAAKRIDSRKFSVIQRDFCFCYDTRQPVSMDLKKYVTHRLRNFYAVSVEEKHHGIEVEYRHNSLPRRKKVATPDGLLNDRHPHEIGIRNTTDDPIDVAMIGVEYEMRFGKGPHHVTIVWATEKEIWAT